MYRRIELFAPIMLVVGVLLLAGCNKKVAKVVPPAPPAATAPTATLAANPSAIEQGQSTELTWHTTSANNINIAGLGEVGASGSRRVTPNSSTTYTLTATGAGGTQEATTRVTVNPTVAKGNTASLLSDRDLFNQLVKDVYFDFNKASLRSDEASTAQGDGSFLAQHADLQVVIEGHCDDRGSEVYNLALGDSRANSLKTTLIAQGVNAERIKTISYGKEHPFCNEDNEACWQQNRRDHVSLQ
jgi:peptidoglycan-associated lipoprotein